MKQKRILRVIVADDHEVALEGITKMVSDAPDIQVIAQTQDLTNLSDLVEQHDPDVVLLDIDWYGDHQAGILMIDRLREIKPDLVIVSVTVYPELIAEASARGVLALKKNFSRLELWAAIRQAYALRDRGPSVKAPWPAFHTLTPREKQVLGYLVKAMTDEQIAVKLNISVGTVKKHVGSILKKLNVSSRTEAAVLAERNGFHPDE